MQKRVSIIVVLAALLVLALAPTVSAQGMTCPEGEATIRERWRCEAAPD